MFENGFFPMQEIPDNNQINSPTCSTCGLSGKCNTPKMEPGGKGQKKIYLLGSNPSEYDDMQGKHFTSKVGELLTSIFEKKGVNIHKDCYLDYAVRCRSTKTPNTTQVQACAPMVTTNIEKCSPNIIVLMGSAALETFIAEKWGKDLGSIDKWRGYAIPDRTSNAWVFPIYDPQFVVATQKKNAAVTTIFKQDIDNIVKYIDTPFPKFFPEEEQITYLWSEREQIAWFESVIEKTKQGNVLLAFDYETTGLKPHAEGHAIACCSMCIDSNEAVVFPFPLSKAAFKWFKRILTHKKVLKSAHNIKFEQAWTKVICGFDVYPWVFCSMQAAHIIDNRPYITGLKFQSYVYFGLAGYDDEISPYLQSVEEKNANAFNRVFEAPQTKLLLYCGIDSLVQYKLAVLQLNEMKIAKKIMKEVE